MTILWINLAIVFIFSFFARYFSMPAMNGPLFIKPNRLMVFVVILSLVLVSGLRKNIGDTFFYMHSYVQDDFSWEGVKSRKDVGFGILQMFLKIFSNDPQILIFTTALITNTLIVVTLYKYARIFELSLYVYITSGQYLVSMNGIRQFLAAAIIFAATKYIFEGNWKRYFLVVLFAMTIHQSAFILIPIYFLIRSKAWSKTTFMLLSLAILIVIGFNQFTAALFTAIESTQYSNYQTFSEGGANVLRVGVDAVPLVLAYLGRERLRELFPKSDYVVNLSLLGVVFMLIATQNWIFARFSIYFGLYQLILISWVVKLFIKESQKLVYYAILVCYFIFCYYEQVITLNVIYKSNFWG
ncbi:EpsG family protein [Ectobacillus funiculus]|uniref:EpsG family protein n=1 Tax=Ectobacillus funiculus TaxID=137993 RepID=UPI0039784622